MVGPSGRSRGNQRSTDLGASGEGCDSSACPGQPLHFSGPQFPRLSLLVSPVLRTNRDETQRAPT